MDFYQSSIIPLLETEGGEKMLDLSTKLGSKMLVVYNFNFFPLYYAVMHGTYAASTARKWFGPKGSKNIPFTLVMSLIYFTTTNLVLSFCFGKTPSIFKDPRIVPIAVVCWYFVFYSPFDLVYKILTKTGILLVLLLWEIMEVGRGIKGSFDLVSKIWGEEFVWAAIVFGTLCGSGGSLMMLFLTKINSVKGIKKTIGSIVRIPFYWSVMYAVAYYSPLATAVVGKSTYLEITQFTLTLFFMEVYVLEFIAPEKVNVFYFVEFVFYYLLFGTSPHLRKAPVPRQADVNAKLAKERKSKAEKGTSKGRNKEKAGDTKKDR